MLYLLPVCVYLFIDLVSSTLVKTICSTACASFSDLFAFYAQFFRGLRESWFYYKITLIGRMRRAGEENILQWFMICKIE